MRAIQRPRISADAAQYHQTGKQPVGGIVDRRVDRYQARIARNSVEIASALRLRHAVFNVELGSRSRSSDGLNLDFDEYDFKCRHLIIVDQESGNTVGTYRLNTLETAVTESGFYSANEFTIEDLPKDVLRDGIEIGRACIAPEHRNTKVLFMLWKALLAYLRKSEKRYFFGCCSIFTRDSEIGRQAYGQLIRDGFCDDRLQVMPKHDELSALNPPDGDSIDLPPLFNMYLRLGAKVCGPPMVDRDFGTVDFFVVFDVNTMSQKYRRMFER